MFYRVFTGLWNCLFLAFVYGAGDGATPEATLRQLLELVAELRFRLADAGDPTATSQAAASGATVARLVCTRLHLLKVPEILQTKKN